MQHILTQLNLDAKKYSLLKRVVVNSLIVHGSSYNRAAKTCDACVTLRDNQSILIDYIILEKESDVVQILGSTLIYTPLFDTSSQGWKCTRGVPILRHAKDISQKLVYLDIDGESFVYEIPNTYEGD